MASPEVPVIVHHDNISVDQGARKTIFVVGLGMVGIGKLKSETKLGWLLLILLSKAFIEKMLTLDEAKRYRLVTCGEGKRNYLRYCRSLPFHGELKYELICRRLLESHLAYNRVALTDYFQHRSVEKLYLNQGGVFGTAALTCSHVYSLTVAIFTLSTPNSGVVCSTRSRALSFLHWRTSYLLRYCCAFCYDQ